MPIPVITLPFTPSGLVSPTSPVSGVCSWITVINVPDPQTGLGGLATSDGSPLVRADLIVDTRKLNFGRTSLVSGQSMPRGTSIRARLVYPLDVVAGMAGVVTPQIRLFAGNDQGGGLDRNTMVPLRNLLGDTSVVFPVHPGNDGQAVFDYGSGALDRSQVATPDNQAHTWDCDGYEFFVFGVERAFAFPGGPGRVMLQAKIV